MLFICVIEIRANNYNYTLFSQNVNKTENELISSNYLYPETSQSSTIIPCDYNRFYDDLDANKDYILNNKEFSLLHLAVATQDISMIKTTLTYDRLLINMQDMNGCTPLHIAVLTENQAIIEILIRLGADVNRSNNEGETPIFNAVRNNSNKILIDYLISEGAIIDLSNKRNQSLTQIAELYNNNYFNNTL
ncbi:MAG: ankyrin repeat domain-containing protein [Spirochaetota bacterium]|nr:ankyrin repeat domain-containing protein [Spirochaetota bacterium]